jgi:thiosulfate/3-mercaptopyruvate sulfurtransferase
MGRRERGAVDLPRSAKPERVSYVMRRAVVGLVAALGVLVLGACEGDSAVDPHEDEHASCIGCHTDYDHLEAIATPDSVIPTGGCSGPPPYVEPHDRVYMGGDGLAAFESSTHGELECTACHNGVDDTSDKAVAHSAGFVKRPSHDNLSACAECHEEIVDGFESTLHYTGRGQKRSQMLRAGVESFLDLPHGIQEGYQQNCSTCHASCGECHVNRPKAAGGGLMNDHAFGPPDMRDNCTACHASRGGHAYYGVGTGTEPDVHLSEAGFTCTDCHSTHELHGDGTAYEYRYKVETLPSCSDCHEDLESSNNYHRMHIEDFNCHTCHSQDYNTCGSCHVGGEGARIHSHQSFKIALNPLPEDRPYEFSTVRRTLAAPDSWEVYGIERLPNFDAKTTFNYTTPHNILRWTSRTQVEEGQRCYESCHIIPEDGYRNRNLYLFRSDMLLDWEVSSNEGIFVDGHLPEDWETP